MKMKQTNQLTQLIWDFWRENRQELRQLKPLAKCQVSRWWGVLHIHCFNRELAEAIMAANGLLEKPIVELRLANKIKIWVDKNLFAVLPVDSDKMLA
ncbi:MAG: hypothetical protein QNJ54_15210 [Prochloraceae cyanobacterium]|nr:hypothetical protein [Prochloraceae cyanobacterium]